MRKLFKSEGPKLLALKASFLLLSLLPSLASASWYDQKLEGWYYFEDPAAKGPEETLTPEKANELVAIESQRLKQLLSLALISPTPSNVEQYLRAQRSWVQQSSTFAQTWRKVLLEHPELGEFLSTPTSSYGILAKRAIDQKKRELFLKELSKNHFLVFFFKGQDPLSAKTAEVAKLFSSSNNWKFKAVSLDGYGISQLESIEVDKGISKNLGVQVSPSFFVINPTDNQAYPVGAGLISVSELESNIESQLGGSNE